MATAPFFDTADMAEGEAVPDEQMDDTELVSILQAFENQAIGYQPGSDDEISTQQERALNYYYRIMDDLPAQEGSSSVVDGLVQVTIDNGLAAILKPFVSSDETVRFTPRGPEDEKVADQATEYVNYVFNSDNPGFLILHDWCKDGLLTKLGVVKCWWESQPKIDKPRQVMIEHDLHAQMLRQEPDYMGEENGVSFHGEQVDDGRIKIENIPPEEFRISKMARSIPTAPYTAHVPANFTRSDLIEMGFDAEIVEGLPARSQSDTDNTLRIARYRDERTTDTVGTTFSEDLIDIRDEYARVDYDGDGVAELRRIIRVDSVILLNEPVDTSPFAGWCPVPMPHKVFGLSLADLVLELQKINTALWRQMLDNLYKSNNPRPVIATSAERLDGSTGDTIADNAPGAEILVNDINGFRFDAVPYTADSSLPMLEMVGMMAEERTGVSRTGQGLDTNALRKSGQMTATEMAMIAGGKNARVEMMARIFAETGVSQLFRLVLGLLSKHQPKARMIRLRNEWVEMDPRGWPEMDVEISVGLGIGEKTEQIAQADSVLQTMAELIQSPYAGLISEENAYNAVKRKFTAAGIKNTDEYLTEPPKDEQGNPVPKPPPPPSPEEQKMQAETQMNAQKLQGDQQAMQAKLEMQAQQQQHDQQLAQQQAEFDANLATAKAQQEAQFARDKAALEAQLDIERMNREALLAERRMQLEEQLANHKASLADKQADAKLSTNRAGGDLDK
jgi:hypothetical protein